MSNDLTWSVRKGAADTESLILEAARADGSMNDALRRGWAMLINEAKRRVTSRPSKEYAGGYLTQKAAGIMALSYSRSPRKYILPYDMADFRAWLRMEPKVPIFLRPAPTRPRHGFVESQEVFYGVDFENVIKSTLKEDPDAEFIVMPRLSGDFSGVATPGSVTFGLGNDGVTGGKGGTVVIPVAPPEYLTDFTRPLQNGMAGLASLRDYGIEHTPFVEMVQDYFKGTRYAEQLMLVQMRDGPEIPATREFIPRSMKVDAVIEVGGEVRFMDLLEWETKVKEYKAEYKGKNVVMNLDMPLSSHYAIHAIEAGFAVINRKAGSVEEGTIIKPSVERTSLSPADYRNIAKTIDKWWKDADGIISGHDVSDADILNTAVATIHSQHLWDDSPHLLTLRGFAVPTLIRFLTAALIGEMRHWFNVGPGLHDDEDTLPHIAKFLPEIKWGGSRDSVYRVMLKPNFTLADMRKILTATVRDFGRDGWDSAFGGRSWKGIAKATKDTVIALQGFQRKPTALRWKKVIMSLNRAVNSAHNNGKALNKWIGNSGLNNIAKSPALGFMNAAAARIALAIPMVNKEAHRGWTDMLRSYESYLAFPDPASLTMPKKFSTRTKKEEPTLETVIQELESSEWHTSTAQSWNDAINTTGT